MAFKFVMDGRQYRQHKSKITTSNLLTFINTASASLGSKEDNLILSDVDWNSNFHITNVKSRLRSTRVE